MLIPYSTDAPVYYFPFATLGLVVVNVLVFIAEFTLPAETLEGLMLTYGTVNPVQWVTSNFIHLGFMHLVGNMVCLWVFGLIVEGKLGWWRFLAVYFALGVGECAVEQLLMLFSTGASCGASAVIFGLMLMALVWAPLNTVSCLLIFGWAPRVIELSIAWFAVFYLVNETVTFFLGSFHFSSAVLHLLGAVAGAIAGVVLLRLKLVDCENWDVFSVLAGRHTLSRDELSQKKAESKQSQQKAEDRRAQLYAEVEHTIAQGNVVLAWRAHQSMAAKIPGWRLPEAAYLQLIAKSQEQQRFSESVPIMVEYLKAYTSDAAAVRMQLAEVLIEFEGRPTQALRVLEKIPPPSLSSEQRKKYDALRRRAEERRNDDDLIELAAEDW